MNPVCKYQLPKPPNNDPFVINTKLAEYYCAYMQLNRKKHEILSAYKALHHLDPILGGCFYEDRGDYGKCPYFEEVVFVKSMAYIDSGHVNNICETDSDCNKILTLYISSLLVTQKEFEVIMGYNPSDYVGENNPVEKVSWYDAVNYCNAISAKEGLTKCYSESGIDVICDFTANGYRLPRMDEWKKGSKAYSSTRYSGSDDLSEVAWHLENSGYKTHPVGLKKPNSFGIYDMNGNVWEWLWDLCEDWDDSKLKRVVIGGSWNSTNFYFYRDDYDLYDPSKGNGNIGFRIARTLIN